MTQDLIEKKSRQPDWLIKELDKIDRLKDLREKEEEEIDNSNDTLSTTRQPAWLLDQVKKFTKKASKSLEDQLITGSDQPSWLKSDSAWKIPLHKSNDWNLDYLSETETDYLKARGFFKYCRGHKPKIVKGIISQIQYMEKRMETNVTLEKVIKSQLPMIREKAELEELDELKLRIEQDNKQIEYDSEINADFIIPTKDDFTFNTEAESQHYSLTHVPFDVENNLQNQTPQYCAAYNYEANRLCLAINTKKHPDLTGQVKLIKLNAKNRSIDVYLIYTPNLWEALFFADIELLTSVIFESALMSGQNHLRSILDKIQLPKKLKINYRLINEHLNGFPKRRSTWIAHNARFDIDMLNDTAKKANYKFTFFQKRLEHDVVKYHMGRIIDPKKVKNPKIKAQIYNVNHYKVHLGNGDAGFRFRITVDNTKGKTIFRGNLSPLQEKSFTHLWITDTIQVSFALQNPEHGLKYISKDTKFKKLDYPTLNFPMSEMDIFTQEKITKPAQYLFFDCFATIAGYAKESQELNYSEMEKLIQSNGLPDFELKIDWRPRMSSLLSTATIAKQFIFPYLEAKTKLKRKQIENNIIHERMYQSNFEEVYSGGISEPTIYGILESDFIAEELVWYDDFESLYPSIARLVFADLMYQLAAKKQLHTYLKTDVRETKQDFWDNMTKIIDIIKQALKGKKIELPEDIFKAMIGTVEIFATHPLQIRIKNEKGKRMWKKIKGRIHLHLIDLMNAVLRAVLEFETPIEVVFNQIKFIKAERFDFRKIKVPEFGKEFFTLMMKLRREKVLTDDPIEKMLKYIINSGVGITAEGISNKEDFTGKLFIPVIFASVTAGSRFLIAIPEIMIKLLGGQMAYTDTDSIIYKLFTRLRGRITQLFNKISILKEETDYGKIIKAFISKKKKYYLLSENINTKKFKKQHIKLPNGKYIVGKIHGISSYEKQLFVETAFPIANNLFENFTIENSQKAIKFAVRKYLQKHPRFMKLTYKKKTEPKIKGILYFYQKTRKINIKYQLDDKWVKEKIQIPNPVFKLFTGKFDEYEIYFYYDLSSNNLLISNVNEKPIRSNFGIYANLGGEKVKIFSTLPFQEEKQLDWENRFLKFVIKTFHEQHNQFYKRIQHKQAKFIINFRETFLKQKKGEFDEHLEITEDNLEERYKYIFGFLKPPITRTKQFFDRTYQPILFKDMKFDKKTKDWYTFAINFDDWFTTEYGAGHTFSTGDAKQLIQNEIAGDGKTLKFFSKLAEKIGFDPIKPPTIREMRQLASEYDLPERSKIPNNELWFWVKDWWWKKYKPEKAIEHLILRIQSDYQHYSFDGTALTIIDAIMDTQTFDYSRFQETIDEKRDLKDIPEIDYENIKGYQLFTAYFQKIVRLFQKQAIAKTDLETKLIKQFTYDKDNTHRFISKTKKHCLITEVEKQKKDVENKEMLTHTILNHELFTDGVDYRLWSYLPEIDFSADLVAYQNKFYSQNLINLARIGSYIYYLTHYRTSQIPKLFSIKPQELPCHQTAQYVHIPMRMRLLLDLNKTTFTENNIKLAYNSFEINKLINKDVLRFNKKQKTYNILDRKEMAIFTHKHVYNKAYMIFGKKKPRNYDNPFPIFIERNYCGESYAFEILTSRGYEYNCKLLIKIVVGENKKENQRVLNADLHINPNSHNLLNIELLKVNIQELETDDFIVKDLLLGLFTVRELAYFSQNASITTEDMAKKEELTYLRTATYLFFTHAILEDAIESNSQTKIGILSLTGQMKPDNVKPKELFAYINSAIVDEHEDWIHSLDPREALRVQSKEITVMPHRASHGISVNHWKKGFNLSLYTKDRHWYKSKMSRTARSRNFEITPALSEQVMNEVWEENTVRFEITLRGFEAIHCKEFHENLKTLEQFFFQLDEIFANHQQSVKSFIQTKKEIRKILPNPLFSTKYTTSIEKLTSVTGKEIETYVDTSGYTHKVHKPLLTDPPPIKT